MENLQLCWRRYSCCASLAVILLGQRGCEEVSGACWPVVTVHYTMGAELNEP